MGSSRPIGLGLFFMLLIARGSGDEDLSDDLPPGSDKNCPQTCPLRKTFPFFNESIQLPQDFNDHPYLRLRISRKNESEGGVEKVEKVPHLRVFIWPNTSNCGISGQLTNGVLRKKATFIVETARYKDGLCMTATAEVDPLGNQSVWTLPLESLMLHVDDFKTSYEVILEGNGTRTEYHRATWLVVLVYVVFCVVFFLLWWLLVFPGTCLTRTKVNSNLEQAPKTEYRQTDRRVGNLNLMGENDVEGRGKTALSWRMMITTGILYFLPSLQFTLRQSTLYKIDGNQDHCFFNFGCLKPGPVTGLIMWNHILSNVGYMFLGLLFLLITFVKENVILRRKLEEMGEEPTTKGSWPRVLRLRWQLSRAQAEAKADGQPIYQTGTCASFSLFYTMGLTLAMIGVMSSCYHLCPTDVNFQFDTTYMYLLAIFMAINLFKSRHPDLSPDATTAFTFLAVSVAMGVVSVYIDLDIRCSLLHIAFFIAYVWSCATFVVVFYGVDYGSDVVDEDVHVHEQHGPSRSIRTFASKDKDFKWIHGKGWKLMYLWVPRIVEHLRDNAKLEFKSKSRFWFLVIFMCVNTLFSCYLLLIAKRDFPSILLFLFLANVSMYLKFYLAMKYMTGERLTLPTWIFMVLAVVFMLPALYFFGSEVKNSEIGAALSKEINQPCFEGLNYFDNHDIWHFLSSFGIFFALAFLLSLDDDVAEHAQEYIQVW